MAELPVGDPDVQVILLGTVSTLASHLVPTGQAMHTEYRVAVQSTILNLSSWSQGPECDVVSVGGAVQTTDGRIYRHLATGLGTQIEVGSQYLMFLKYYAGAACFRVAKLWQLRNGVAVATSSDDLARVTAGSSTIHGISTEQLVAKLQQLISAQVKQ
jgi:hypothetical protein